MADTRTINWTTGDGREAVVTLTADYDLDEQGRRRTVGRKVIEVDATVNGDSLGMGLQIIPVEDHPVVVAKIGGLGIKTTLGMTAANYDRVAAAMSELESLIADHNAQCDANAAADQQYHANHAEFVRQMRAGE